MPRFSQTAYSLATDPSSRAALIDRLALLAAGGAGELTPARAAALAVLGAGGAGELTPARAALLSNLDVAVSTRPAGADWTAARAAFLDAAISSRLGKINAIIEGTIDVAAAGGGGAPASAAATISAVTVARCQRFFGGVTRTTGDSLAISGYMELTNATTVTAFNGHTSSARVKYVIIEYAA